MERLTTRCCGAVLIADSIDGKYSASEVIDILAARLADYEDTGLTPEEIKAMSGTIKARTENKADVCVCCGAIIPEGRHVCHTCKMRAGL